MVGTQELKVFTSTYMQSHDGLIEHCLCCILCSQSALAPSQIVVGMMHMGDVLSFHHDLRPAAQGHSKLEQVDTLSCTRRKKEKKKERNLFAVDIR